MIPLTLPKLSLSMEEGTVLNWLVEDGARVEAGQPVVEIETDKATTEVEAPADGVLRIAVDEGASVAVESTLAQILAPEEEQGPEPPPTEEPTLAAPPPSEGPSDRSASGQVGKQEPAQSVRRASPAARRLAREHGVDLAEIDGTGPKGRISVADVEKAIEDSKQEPTPEPVQQEPAETGATEGRLREAVIANISSSWQEIPHVHIGGELEADGLARAKKMAADRFGKTVTATDLLILATARTLLDIPELNGTFSGDGGVQRAEAVHLGLAVATEDGVVAPVIRYVTDMGITVIARERARLVEAAREHRLEKRDLAGATCTLSNLGAYPVDFFAPVISGPQLALVATGRLAERPVAVDGMLAVRNRLWVNVAIDHRAADGVVGGRFLAALERRLEELPANV